MKLTVTTSCTLDGVVQAPGAAEEDTAGIDPDPANADAIREWAVGPAS